jgi:hypothetical protein
VVRLAEQAGLRSPLVSQCCVCMPVSRTCEEKSGSNRVAVLCCAVPCCAVQPSFGQPHRSAGCATATKIQTYACTHNAGRQTGRMCRRLLQPVLVWYWYWYWWCQRGTAHSRQRSTQCAVRYTTHRDGTPLSLTHAPTYLCDEHGRFRSAGGWVWVGVVPARYVGREHDA